MGEEFGSTLAVRLIQDYLIIEPLGRGAYSYVYRVKNRQNGCEYALKAIEKSQLKRSVHKRLMAEIQIQSSLDHPNIVKLFHHFEDESTYFLVLEFCPGGELFHYIKSEGRLKEETAVLLCGQLVEGLGYLHSRKIIHRDLKLGNLLLNEECNFLKIADFGLAKELESLEAESQTVCGTPNYISPEIANRQPHGFPSDLWGLGCIIFACLAGHPPFESATVAGTLSNIKDMAFELPDNFSEEAKALISSLLVWEKRDRMTVQEVKQHPFFHNFLMQKEDTMRTSQNKSSLTLDTECSFFEYRETFSSPKPVPRTCIPTLPLLKLSGRREEQRLTSTPRLRRDTSETRLRPANECKSRPHDLSLTFEAGKLAPLNSEHLKPITHSITNGSVSITESGWVTVEAGKRKIEISQDGLVVIYCGKKVPLSALSSSARKLYEYAKDFVQAVKSKTPKVTHEDEFGEYLLMWNAPYPNFEAVFKTGERVLYQIGGERMTVRLSSGQEVSVSPHKPPSQKNHGAFQLAEKALAGLMVCFRLEKGMKS